MNVKDDKELVELTAKDPEKGFRYLMAKYKATQLIQNDEDNCKKLLFATTIILHHIPLLISWL